MHATRISTFKYVFIVFFEKKTDAKIYINNNMLMICVYSCLSTQGSALVQGPGNQRIRHLPRCGTWYQLGCDSEQYAAPLIQ